MVNAKDIIAGKKDKSELGVKALDDNTLVVELETAVPYFVMMTGPHNNEASTPSNG